MAETSDSTMSSKGSRLLNNAPTNPRGIPLAPFVDKVEDYVTSRSEVESTLKSFQEMISKYQFMESSTQRRLASLQEKVPDIQKTLDMVLFLKNRDANAEELETVFELNETLYARATVPRSEEVYLWLGANVMLAYSLKEASALLTEKLDGAVGKRRECSEDVEFLREQITVC